MQVEFTHNIAAVRFHGAATNIYTVSALKQPMLDALSCLATASLDLSDVSEMDSAGLQLLLLLKRETNALGRSLRLVGGNSLVDETLELCDLSHAFVKVP